MQAARIEPAAVATPWRGTARGAPVQHVCRPPVAARFGLACSLAASTITVGEIRSGAAVSCCSCRATSHALWHCHRERRGAHVINLFRTFAEPKSGESRESNRFVAAVIGLSAALGSVDALAQVAPYVQVVSINSAGTCDNPRANVTVNASGTSSNSDNFTIAANGSVYYMDW